MSEARRQFTFYRSYFEAVRELPKKEQLATLLAICAYALDEEEPALSGVANAVFSLVRPTLDAGRRKAQSGRAGGRAQANAKQRAGESECETEKEYEPENDCYSAPHPADQFQGALREAVSDWLAYKAEKRQPYRPTGLKSLLAQIRRAADTYGDAAVVSVIRDSMASNYQGIVFDRLRQAGTGAAPTRAEVQRSAGTIGATPPTRADLERIERLGAGMGGGRPPDGDGPQLHITTTSFTGRKRDEKAYEKTDGTAPDPGGDRQSGGLDGVRTAGRRPGSP